MSHRTIVQDRQQLLVAQMTRQMTTLMQHLSARLATEPPTLAALEHEVLRLGKDLLASLLSSLVPLLLSVYEAPEHSCS